MEYRYEILHINRLENWITITSNDEFDFEEPDSFVYLLKKIREEINGKIESVGDMQYSINGDGLGLIYQWDSCFGISVIYPENVTEEDAIEFLKQFF